MTSPLRVTVSSGIPAEWHPIMRHLIEVCGVLTEAPLEHTEIHVKAGSKMYRRTTGYAYYYHDGLPFSVQPDCRMRSSVHPDACELVTIKMGAHFWEYYRKFGPRIMHYGRYKTFPYTRVFSVEEEFVYLVAHEMQHVTQYHRPRLPSGRASASELECEMTAIGAVVMYRLLEGLPERAEREGKGGLAHAARS